MEMSNWKGSAGICINEKKEVLLILQGPPDDEKKWSVPAGPAEKGETLEESCIREFSELTGFTVRILESAGTKKDSFDNADVSVELQYFLVEIVGGELLVWKDDPWIREIAWQPVSKLASFELADPGEAELIKSIIR